MAGPPLNPPSTRFPFAIEGKVDPAVEDAIRSTYNGLTVHEQAFTQVKSQLDTLSSDVESVKSSSTSSSPAGAVSTFNGASGAVSFFPQLGIVNDQLGNTLYITQTQDNGAKIIVGDSSPVELRLNFNVSTPWYTIIDNDSSATCNLTATQGTVFGAQSIPPGGFGIVFFDGVNWWAGATPVSGGSSGVTQIVAGSGISVSPVGGTGVVTVTAAGTGLGGTLTTANITLGAGAGTGATVVVSGQDGNHQISVTTGTSPTPGSPIYTVNFTTSRGRVTYPIVSAGDSTPTPGLLVGITASSSTAYTLTSPDGLSPTTTYTWNVSCP